MKFDIQKVLDELDRVARTYGGESAEKRVDYRTDTVAYNFDLGGKKCGVLYLVGKHTLIAGLKDGEGRYTDKVEKHYKELIRDFEDDILEWCHAHPLCAKFKGAQENGK